MNFKMTALVCVSVLGLAACGDNSSNSNNPVDNRLEEAALLHKWKGACENQALDLLKLSAAQTEYDLASNDVKKIVTYFEEDNCTNGAMKVEIDGNFGNVEKIDPANDISKIDFNFKTIGVTPLTQTNVELLNTIAYCGSTDWAVNVTKDITAKTSDNAIIDRCWTKVPYDQFDIMQVKDSELRLGAGLSDKSTPEERPTELNNENVFKR